MNNEKTPDEIMLNPSYLKKLNEIEARRDELPPYLLKELEEYEKNPLNKIDNEFIRKVLDYLSDEKNSSEYKRYLFDPSIRYDMMHEENYNPHETRITIPILFGTF